MVEGYLFYYDLGKKQKNIPGNHCLWIAIKYLIKAKIFIEGKKFVISALYDLSNFMTGLIYG